MLTAMMKRLVLLLAILAAPVAHTPPRPVAASFTPLTPEERAVKSALSDLVRQEDAAILAGDEPRLRAVFLPGREALQALDEARERQNFLRAWSKSRGLRLLSVKVSLRTPHITFRTPDRVQVYAVVSETYAYRYRDEALPQRFGLGVRHDYFLVRQDGRFYIRADYFTDPLDQDTRIPGTALPASGTALLGAAAMTGGTSRGQMAAAYADNFCGAAPGCGNHGLYNQKYNNYNGEGGDCTNFISQSLKAGGFRETAAWNYDRRAGEGSRAWSNAEGLRDYLDGSDRACIYAYGRFSDVMRPTPALPVGAAHALRIGDLISYVEHGRAVHTGIVVAFDSRGVPLVDTHTGDRYHVPWDLGWDRTTRYLLWHVNYSEPGSASRRSRLWPTH